MKITGIYSIRQISSGKRYIGSSVNIKRRWASHRSSLRRNINDNVHLQNAWNKYGEKDFLFEILDKDVEEHLLENLENEYLIKFEIATRDTDIFNHEKGFNMFWAGREGCANSINTKRGIEHYAYGKEGVRKGKTMPEWFKEEQSKRMIGNARHSIPHSEESKRKMSESKRNKPWSEARREAQNNRK